MSSQLTLAHIEDCIRPWSSAPLTGAHSYLCYMFTVRSSICWVWKVLVVVLGKQFLELWTVSQLR
jgi:hypothetical protein